MADRTRSSNRRTTHQHSSIVAQQNAPRRSTRSTSRSHDTSGAERAKLSVKERKTAGPTVVDDVEGTMSGGIQSGGKKNRNTRSKPAEDLSAVQEDAGVEYPDLPQNGEEQSLPGDFSAFSGSTARPSISTLDMADSNQRKVLLKKAAVEYDQHTAKDEHSAHTEPVFSQPLELSRTLTERTGDSSYVKNLDFNSAKNMKTTVNHILGRRSGRMIKESSSKNTVAAVADSSKHDVSPQQQINRVATPSFQPDGIRAEPVLPSETEDTWRPFIDDEESPVVGIEQNLESDAVAKARQVIEQKNRYEAESYKENLTGSPNPLRASEHQPPPEKLTSNTEKLHFLDRQLNATRVSPLESQEPNKPNHGRYLQEIGPSASEAHEEADGSSLDDGFEHDTRNSNNGLQSDNKSTRKRFATGPAATSRQPPKKGRHNQTHDDDVAEDIGAAGAWQENARPNYIKVNAGAKRSTAKQTKKVQIRKAWTERETETLIDLIEEHGTSWTLLKESDTDGVLKFRDQVALKDKARNMKLDFLKVGPYMPINFERIVLNKSQIDKLQSLGIEYDSAKRRLDGDEVDADG